MQIKIGRSGGVAGTIRKADDVNTDYPPIVELWKQLVEKTGLLEIKKGEEMKNWSNVSEIVGRDCYSYWVEADGRTIIYNQGVPNSDQKFQEVAGFVETVLDLEVKRKFEEVRRRERLGLI